MSEENELLEEQELPQENEEEATSETSGEEEPAEETAEAEKKDEKQGVPPGVQRRIDQITRQRYEAERKAQELEEKLKQYETPQEPQKPQGRPKLEDFNYDEDQYHEALADWKFDQKLAAYRKEQEQRQKQDQQRSQQQEFESRRNQVIANGLSKYDDFEDVALNNPDLVITPVMADILTQSDISADIAYWLGKNPAESARIANLNPLAQAREFGKIEASLSQKPAKKSSSAPPPVKPVGSRGATPATLEPTLGDGRVNPAWVQARNEGKL